MKIKFLKNCLIIIKKKVDFQFEEMHDHGVKIFCEDLNESTLEEKVDLDSYFAFNFLFAYFL